jgi:hypothetical protein
MYAAEMKLEGRPAVERDRKLYTLARPFGDRIDDLLGELELASYASNVDWSDMTGSPPAMKPIVIVPCVIGLACFDSMTGRPWLPNGPCTGVPADVGHEVLATAQLAQLGLAFADLKRSRRR